MNPPPLTDLVTLVDDGTYLSWQADRRFDGWRCVEIDLDDVDGADALFARAHSGLGLPDSAGLRNWSSLEDHLWTAVVTADEADAALVVRNVDALLDDMLAEFIDLIGVLNSVATQAQQVPDVEVRVRIVLTGIDLNFPTDPGHT